ncbi:uncharacterized protein C8orf88 homolog [Xyrichtys novacula]|uniref:Uncharacterized protein C8orf88 homolog n=1 Tax=Xyrichtys novacula TaxID=13765 RepID=A0AAV1FLM9_XYRNO|nr:uncharacterized protein C8orf88 homolog [Xyrichtys novacula]
MLPEAVIHSGLSGHRLKQEAENHAEGVEQKHRMEVSRRRVLQKHLEPARPLRRCIQVENEPNLNATCAQAMIKEINEETNIGIEQFYKIVNLHKQREGTAQGRISYSRDFLIGLASCPEARKKPEYLPEHPVVLTEARDLKHIKLHKRRWNGGNGDMMEEQLYTP